MSATTTPSRHHRRVRLIGRLLAALMLFAPLALAPTGEGAANRFRITTTVLPAPTAGKPYSFTLTAKGGKPPYHWSIDRGQLPNGLTLSNGGVISGTPKSGGSSTFTVLLLDSAAPAADELDQTFALDVGPQQVYVLNRAAASVTEYGPGPQGNTPPITTLTGATTGTPAPAAIALSRSGELYVADGSNNSIAVYAAGATGGAPLRTISGAQTGLSTPVGIAIDARGDAYVTNDGTNTVTEYAPGVGGNAPPIAVIGGPATDLAAVNGITIDRFGRVVVGAGEGEIAVFAPGSSGNIAPSFTIGGPVTGIAFAVGLAYRPDGGLDVLSRSQSGSAVIELPADTDGDAVPVGTIAGPHTQLLNSAGIAVDATGRVLVANEGTIGTDSTVTTYAADATGDAAPVSVLKGEGTGLDDASGIAIGAPFYATTASLPPAKTGMPYHAAIAAALGVAPYRFTLAIGALPAGLHLTRRGVITGNPTSDGIAHFIVVVSDSARPVHHTVDQSLSIDVGVPALQYIANSAFTASSVTAYDAGSSDDATPRFTIAGPDTGLNQPQALTFDPSGRLYVANYDSRITVYAPNATGDAAPVRTIAGASTGLYAPSALVVDGLGNLYVANQLGGTVTEYGPDANGNVAPTATITGLADPTALAFDALARLWVNSGDELEAIQTGVSGPADATATLAGPDTGLNGIKGIAFDADGWLHVSNLNSGAVTTYLPGTLGDAAPMSTIAVALPWGAAVDAAGRVTVASNQAPGALISFDRFGSNAYSVSGAAAGLAQPTGVADTPQ